MAITITRDLNVVSVGVPPVIHLSQYDSDFTLVFNLYASTGAFTMPTGTTAEIRGTKRDGNGYDAAASVSGSTVTVTGDEQMTAIAGQNMFEIATYYNNKRLNTINFILYVERAALDADTITSESVLRELDAIIQGAATATQAAEDAEDAADRAEEAADDMSGTVQQVATNTQDIAGLKDDLSHIEGISDEVKEALLNCFLNVEWTNGSGRNYYDALTRALYGRVLPDGYEAVTYLESTGTQYIVTNVLSQIPLELEAKFSAQENVGTCIGSVSTQNTATSRFYILGVNDVYGTKASSRFGDSDWFGLDYTFGTSVTIRSGVQQSGVTGYVNGYVEGESGTVIAQQSTPTHLGLPIIVFAKPLNVVPVSMRLYFLKFRVDGQTIFDGVPCLRTFDSKPGIYDIENDVFYTNAGTGEFIYA